MDSSQFQAAQANGRAQEHTGHLTDKATSAVQSAKETCVEVGNQLQAKASGAADAVKNTVQKN